MSCGIILVHGYSGSPDELAPLAAAFRSKDGHFTISLIRLPGHAAGQVPLFDQKAFTAAVTSAAVSFKRQGMGIVIIGHSTGGSIALAAVQESEIRPDLLVLASVPKGIDVAAARRWEKHRQGKKEIPFSSVAAMVSCINHSGAQRNKGCFPVLVLHGEQDVLAPAGDAQAWQSGFSGPVRTVLVPGAGHDLFKGPNSSLAIDLVLRAAADAVNQPGEDDQSVLGRICSSEPEAGRFIQNSPGSARHLVRSPSGRSAADLVPDISVCSGFEPVIANIEITTKCNLRCGHCARTFLNKAGEDMQPDTYKGILGMLPHAYRITLVGLGETLLHPNVVDFISEAAGQGRRVALVTNGMLLDARLSKELLKAGLESIAFSIDAATQEMASKVRPGTDLDLVIDNVKRFVSISKKEREISTAVFSAVSSDTLSCLDDVIELVSGLGVHVMMLSDLNFRENLDGTVWKNITEKHAGQIRASVARAFRKGLPVLSVRGLEEFGLWKRYNKFLLLPPDQLYQRSGRRAWCCSPWQTIPVNVRGEVTLCDCQPEASAGNLLARPFSEIWDGELFTDHRARMLGNDPPEACRICPRF